MPPAGGSFGSCQHRDATAVDPHEALRYESHRNLAHRLLSAIGSRTRPLHNNRQPVFDEYILGIIIMPMQAESLEVLEKADVPSAQARAIVRAIEIEIAGAKDTLATKHDVLMLRHEMAEIRGELKSEIHASASSITRQMYASMLGQMAVLLGIAYFFVTNIA
jgi:hypothetical protein